MDIIPDIRRALNKKGDSKPLPLPYLPPAPSGEKVIRTPDCSFGHINEECPSVVVEISCERRRKDLARLAHEYIFGTRGGVKLVVGLDIERKGSQKATVSVWKPKVINNHGMLDIVVLQTVKFEPFRDEEGNTPPDGKLKLSIEDFAPAKYFVCVKEPLDGIEISYAMLAGLLSESEQEIAETAEQESAGMAEQENDGMSGDGAGEEVVKAGEGDGTGRVEGGNGHEAEGREGA